MVRLNIGSPEIAEAVDAAIENAHEEEERFYLGGSAIGDPCERKLWLRFRWAYDPERFSGRMLRLFRNGHEKEAIVIDDLRAAGILVTDLDPETGEQWRGHAMGGHASCAPDGIASNVPTAPKAKHILELKTHNDKSFQELKAHGVAVAKPLHVSQMQFNMHLFGIDRALYVALNKNTEELYTERVHYDMDVAERLLAKAKRIIEADHAPSRIRDEPGSYPCRLCALQTPCHSVTATPRRNCRTCMHVATDIVVGGWHCTKHEEERDIEAQRAGCPDHRILPSLIRGQIIDVDHATEEVTYRLNDGRQWTDDGENPI